jgi:hypothetical protein
MEHASDDELHAAASQHRSIRQAALDDQSAPVKTTQRLQVGP